MANVGEVITASWYNVIRNRVASVLGAGSSDKGYGQVITSMTAANQLDIITTAKLNDLRSYINIARMHQLGNSVGYDTTTLPPISSSQEITAELMNIYDTASTQIYTESLSAGLGSLTLTTNALTSSKATPWNGTITSTITATWPSEDQARWFFNSGGDIRIQMSHPTGAPGDNSWNTVFNGLGTVAMKAHSTTSTGTLGTPNPSVGFYELPTDPSFATILDGTNIDPTYSSSYQFIDDFYIRVSRITNGLLFTIEIDERNDGVIAAGTAAKISFAKATTYLTNPLLVSPTLLITKAF